MVDPEIVREWVAKALEDFDFARINFEERRPFWAQICFHFHQSAEKHLKAFIIANELDFRKTHDLLLLLRICSSKDRDFESLRDECEYLNTFYLETRYPVHWPTHLTQNEAQKALQSAERTKALVEKKVKTRF